MRTRLVDNLCIFTRVVHCSGNLQTSIYLKGLDTLYQHGLTVAPVTLRKKPGQLGEICEQQIQEWKKTCENTKQDEICLVLLKNELLSCNYLPHVPTVCDMKNYMTDERKNSHDTNIEEFQTIDE